MSFTIQKISGCVKLQEIFLKQSAGIFMPFISTTLRILNSLYYCLLEDVTIIIRFSVVRFPFAIASNNIFLISEHVYQYISFYQDNNIFSSYKSGSESIHEIANFTGNIWSNYPFRLPTRIFEDMTYIGVITSQNILSKLG